MDLTQVTILVLLGFFRIISGNVSSCKFGENCIYPCHCQDNVVCDANDGSCTGGCDNGDLQQPGDYWYTGAWSGYGCQLGNVAFMKSATQHGNYNNYSPLSAVDGGHYPIMSGGSCAHPGSYNSVAAWWQVDLGTVYVVLSINITNRDAINNRDNERRTAHLNIFVSETRDEDTMATLCYAVGAEGSMPSTYVNCPRPMKGQHVKLIRQTGANVYQSNWMSFCEVQVYGYLYHNCPENYFGVACGLACHCQDQCDNLNGTCLSGHCLGGWEGDDCQTPCVGGKWGANCPNDCHCMVEKEACDRVNGQCSSGCDMTYGGLSCNLVIPTLGSMIRLTSVSQTSLTIHFEASIPDNIKEETPVVYDIQQRLNGTITWVPSHVLPHSGSAEYITMLEDLEPDALYYVSITPVIEENGIHYPGFAKEAGPFWTLDYAETDHTPTIAGVVVTLAVIALLLAVSVLLARRYMRRKHNTNKESTGVGVTDPAPYAEIGYETPNVEGDIPPQNTYEEIDNVVKSVPGKKLHEQPLYQNQNATERPIPLTELASYINRMTKTKDGFKKDFENICNRLCIRSGDFEEKEYEHLIPASNDMGNRNYVNTTDISKHRENPKGYISKGVPPNSAAHELWNVVCETGANRIVILTALQCNKMKSDYEEWPVEGTTSDGEFEVNLVSKKKYSHYTIKALSVKNAKMGKSNPVSCYHFTGWPDNGIPGDVTNLLEFRRKVHIRDDTASGPLIILSNFGDGRSGTFIALDHLLEISKNAIDVVKFINDMGNDSSVTMQTPDQYEFVYRALLEAFQSEDTIVAAMDLQQKYPVLKETDEKTGENILQTQFSLLERVKPKQILTSREGALLAENVRNNRDPSIAPLDKYRPLLRSHVDGTNDYINAVYIDGYCERRSYIATQLPMPYALVDIWRLVYDHNCSCIIALDQPDNEDMMTPVYWPTKKEKPFVVAQMSVTLLKQELQEEFFSIAELEITLNKVNPHRVRLYQFFDWPTGQDTPTSLSNTLHLLEHGRRWKEHSAFHTMTFLCKYGYKRCGLMIAACYMLENLTMDDEVDVFQAVKQVRISRPELVTSVAQYEFLHELAIAYIDSCEEYSNFK